METRYNVLIVEDDAFIRKVLRHTLNNDFEVTTQINGIEAMTWLEEGHAVDIVITDLQMPYMTGQELIRNIRASSLFNHLPVIILSTYDDSNTRIACLEMGADDYMIKPFNPMEVKAKILALLRRAEYRKASSSPTRTTDGSSGN
ncbi:response regulator transcription factor [Tellurirhabdus bombi]|uniref:response regulator transcription factor n=1 Tax=Tellurirhabdus bombi TaxID=2907205 RepID=UPI001F3ACCAC|nr:response regulator transcription factor [Tellurirhabdus bombi]